jgi:hypothetical protein
VRAECTPAENVQNGAQALNPAYHTSGHCKPGASTVPAVKQVLLLPVRPAQYLAIAQVYRYIPKRAPRPAADQDGLDH